MILSSADVIDSLSRDALDKKRLCAKSTLMYKMFNDHATRGLTKSFIRRNSDQNSYHLRNSAADLTLPKQMGGFLKRSFMYTVLYFLVLITFISRRFCFYISLHFMVLRCICVFDW